MDIRQHDEIMQRLADVMAHQKTLHGALRTVIATHDENMREVTDALAEMAITLVEVRTLLASLIPHAHLNAPSC